MKQEHIKKYIAIGVVLLLFAPIIFGSRIFPNIFPFTVLQRGFFGGNIVNTTGSTTSRDESDNSTGLNNLSEPVTILDLQIGDGELAEAPKTVHVGYVGTRLDPNTGEEIIFDQNLDKESPFAFQLGSGAVISGFEQGVTGMRVGGTRLVIIKPEMGYGNQQAGDIPPNTTLQFMIELYAVKE